MSTATKKFPITITKIILVLLIFYGVTSPINALENKHHQNIPAAKTYPIKIIPAASNHMGKIQKFQVERAISDEEQSQGLMFRNSLPENGGMIFLYKTPQIVRFWMKNTLIPLDLFFIASGGEIISIKQNAEPLSLANIESGGKIVAVLELAGGSAAKYQIKIGDRVEY